MAEKPKSKKEKEAGKASQEAKVMVIPLRAKARRSAKNKRMNRSVREIKLFLAKHMGTELSNVSISQQLNEFLWKGGFHNPPSKIRVRVSSDEDGKVLAKLIDEIPKKGKERKSRLRLRERLARRKEGKKSEKPKEEAPETKKEEKPAPKTEEKKPASKPQDKKTMPPEEEIEQATMLEE